MENSKKKFGFGCMRLPMNGKEADYTQVSKMVDLFLENGFNYFDTAHGYLGGASEIALRECLTKRYPREAYILTDKLTTFFFNKKEEIRPLFQKQLDTCGVEYFDFYLMHAQSKEHFAKFKKCEAYEVALELKEEGKIKHFGISFHDSTAVLEQILTEYPQIEVVQIQLNYVDYDDPAVQGRECYEVCCKFGKPVIVMEPTKGGNLVNLPDDAKAILDELGSGSIASYAIRYAAGFEGVMMVLSGMSNMEQMEDNISYMKDFKPLNEQEMKAVQTVCDLFKAKNLIPCTACRYCIEEGCPQNIAIPDLFACLNAKKAFHNWNTDYYYHNVYTIHNGKASDCIKCGKCEKACPQHLEIRNLMVDVAEEFEQSS
ncbi:MAG: aldo/keto reductase [Lachnospiraceae bacterium]